MTKHYQNFRLEEGVRDDLLAMAEYVGKPGNLTAGLYALVYAWRRYKAEHDARLDRAAQIARQEERLAALDRHEEAEGR